MHEYDIYSRNDLLGRPDASNMRDSGSGGARPSPSSEPLPDGAMPQGKCDGDVTPIGSVAVPDGGARLFRDEIRMNGVQLQNRKSARSPVPNHDTL